MPYSKPDGKTSVELEEELMEVFLAYPEYNNTDYGSGRFHDMVVKFAEDNFYKLHLVAREYMKCPYYNDRHNRTN